MVSDTDQNQTAVFFREALDLIQDGFLFDGIAKFKETISSDPEGDLADDAQYNIALCYFKMNQFKKALENFQKVISDYPDATIAYSEENKEYGQTAAKAYLGILSCRLALGDEADARKALDTLQQYDDSYVLQGSEEIKKTFYDLGKEMMAKSKEYWNGKAI